LRVEDRAPLRAPRDEDRARNQRDRLSLAARLRGEQQRRLRAQTVLVIAVLGDVAEDVGRDDAAERNAEGYSAVTATDR
jgi:hypothetical protein